MPIILGGKVIYKNWADCISHQKGKGKSQEVADKVCGYLEAKAKGTYKKGKKKK